jgi:hypothetical protein
MTAEVFYRTIVEKLERKSFQPFVMELNDGRRIDIDRPKVAIRGGVAVCTTKERLFVRVDSDDVKEIVDIPANLSKVKPV